jgi:lipocalin-like protein
MEGFVAYAGRYRFHGDRVIHHVELSLFPNWVGSDQQRWLQLAGDRLTLSASPLLLAGTQQVPPWSGSGSTPGQAPADRCQPGSTGHDPRPTPPGPCNPCQAQRL